MHVSIIPEKKSGRKLIVFAESYRDGKKNGHRTIRRIGYVDEFTAQYPDPIAHFRQVAREETEQLKRERQKVVVELAPEALLPFDRESGTYDCVRNIGHAAVSAVFHRLGIAAFVDDRRKYLDASYNLTAVTKLLVYERLLAPGSKRAAWLGKAKYFDKMDFDLNAVYRSLSILAAWRNDLVASLHQRMLALGCRRETTLLYYDVTNYYFEIEDEDGLRKMGAGKEHRPNPIVQMGLFMDEQGFPVTYDLFSGNTNDCLTFGPMSRKVRSLLDLGHLVFVADKGMMSGPNVAEVITGHNGYVFSKSVRKGSDELKRMVRDPSGYLRFDAQGNLIATGDTDTELSFMYKVIDEVATMRVNDAGGKRRSVRGIGRYQVVIYSRKYARRAALERMGAVEKALAASHCQSRDVIDNNHGKNRYLKTQVSDPRTHQIIQDYQARVLFDVGQLDEDESLDGYYVIETNVTGWQPLLDAKGRQTGELEGDFGSPSRWLAKEGMLQLNRTVSPLDILDMYRGLWKIEQSFRITKNELETRPVYVSREDRINAHFLTCFISLLIVRILEHELDCQYSSEQILASIRKANVAPLDDSTFLNLYYDPVLRHLKEKLGIDFGRNVYTKAAIRSLLGGTKKDV